MLGRGQGSPNLPQLWNFFPASAVHTAFVILSRSFLHSRATDRVKAATEMHIPIARSSGSPIEELSSAKEVKL